MKKIVKKGFRYRISSFGGRVDYNHQKITSLNFIIELKIINIKTNREILFVTNNDKEITPALKYVDKLGNSDYDIQKSLFIAEYIRASYENKKLEIFINNKELEKYGYKVSYKFKEFSKNIVTDTVEIYERLADITTEFKISVDEFKEILYNNHFVESDKLMLDGTKNYEVKI